MSIAESTELQDAFAALEAAQPRSAPDANEVVATAVATAVGAAVVGAIRGAVTATRAATPAPPHGAGALGGAYTRYLALFVGAGLMAGAVVHFPLAPVRYAVMGLAGATMFALGSIGEGFGTRSVAERARWLAASLVVALAVGMVAGGIQHFSDIPDRATVLIPFGLAIGLVAFAVRDGHRIDRRQTLAVAATVLGVASVTWLVLRGLVPADAAAAVAAGHGH